MKSKVCIIGSGPAGTFASEILVKNGIDVLMIEEGNENKNCELEEFLDHTLVAPKVTYDYGFSKQIGGTSNLWSGRVAPLELKDFNFEYKGKKYWPITYGEILKYYKFASKKLDINFENIWNDKNNLEKNIPNIFKYKELNNFEFKKFFWRYPSFNCMDYLKNNHLKFNNFNLISNTKVLRLFQNSQDGRIIYLEAVTNQKVSVKIESEFFIIANGGIEAPRLLLNSNSNSPSGIGNNSKMVGKCLMTHPKANIGLLYLNKAININNPLFNKESENSKIRYGIGLNLNTNHLNHYLQLTPYLKNNVLNPLSWFYNKENFDNQFFKDKVSFNSNVNDLKILLRNKLFSSNPFQIKSRRFILRAYLDQYPEQNNKVFLSNNKDIYGLQKVSINWQFNNIDKIDFLGFFRNFQKYVLKNNFGNIYSNINSLKEWPLKGIHSHFIGTTRMGNNPSNSVVDINCKVHDIPNLFIAGPSIFPSSGYANPFLTIIAFSLRLSEYLTKLILNKK